MKTKNYNAWQHLHHPQSGQSLAIVIIESLKAGILAPSTHNTQPWKLQIYEHGLLIKPNYQLCLPAADPKNRGIFVSLGCFIANVQVTAAAYGYETFFTVVGDQSDFHPYSSSHQPGQQSQDRADNQMMIGNQQLVATKSFIQVSFQKQKSVGSEVRLLLLRALFDSITTRYSDKGKYLPKRIPCRIMELATRYVTIFSSQEFRIEQGEEAIKLLAGQYRQAAYEMSADRLFRDELSQWLRANNTKRSDGMPGFVSGLPMLMSWVGPVVIRYFVLPLKIQSIKDAKNLNSAPAVGIIAGSQDDTLSWINAGIAYQLIALVSRKFGISTTPMAALVENQNYPTFLKSFFKIPKLTPHMFFRLGYSGNREIHTPRRSVLEAVDLS